MMLSLGWSPRWKGMRRAVVRPPTAQMSPKTRVKICGVTNVDDAKRALSFGADFLGMIMWPKAKRHVSLQTAKDITQMSKTFQKDTEGFPKVVGVFVDETVAQIEDIRKRTNIDVVQLHGDVARASLPYLQTDISVIYVLHADQQGELHYEVHSEPNHVAAGQVGGMNNGLKVPVDWLLIDGPRGGSGQQIPLEKLQLPDWINDHEMIRKGWLLAGGLNPNNVADALSVLRTRSLRPLGVDVSSGVCDEGGLTKSPTALQEFIYQSQR